MWSWQRKRLYIYCDHSNIKCFHVKHSCHPTLAIKIIIYTWTESGSISKIVKVFIQITKVVSNIQNDENWNSFGFHIILHWEFSIDCNSLWPKTHHTTFICFCNVGTVVPLGWCHSKTHSRCFSIILSKKLKCLTQIHIWTLETECHVKVCLEISRLKKQIKLCLQVTNIHLLKLLKF